MAILIGFALFDVPRQGMMSPCNFPKLDRKRDFSCLPFYSCETEKKAFCSLGIPREFAYC